MKRNINITVDVDLVEEAQSKGVNLSGTINDLLRDFLKPKKADFVKEDLTLQVVAFGKNLGLDADDSVFTHENLNKDATAIWRNFRESFKPKFTLFDYMEIRKKFNERFFSHDDVLKQEQMQKEALIIAKEDASHDKILEEVKING